MGIAYARTWEILTRPAPDQTAAFICAGLNALVFLDPALYDARLGQALGNDTSSRFGGDGVFVPHVLQLVGPQGAVFSFEGTRAWAQWANFVVGAGVVQWHGNHGDVFAPFAGITDTIRAAVLAAAQPHQRTVMTGHSLGAASCALLVPLLIDQGTKVESCYLMASPRAVGQRFRDTFGMTAFLVNHPFDPVPSCVPDCVTDLRRDPFRMQWRGPLYCPGESFWLPRHVALVRGLRPLDYLAGIAGNFGGGESSCHATFRYVSDTYADVPVDEAAELTEYVRLLVDLGLFLPWRA